MEKTLDGFVYITSMHFSLRGLFHVPECTDLKKQKNKQIQIHLL